jgi:hypothetical protein
MKVYSDRLPRRINRKVECNALNNDGSACRKRARYETTLSWVRICLCEYHLIVIDRDRLREGELKSPKKAR